MPPKGSKRPAAANQKTAAGLRAYYAAHPRQRQTSQRVSQALVTQLRRGTMAGNIAAARAPGASAQLIEAVHRFYPTANLGGAVKVKKKRKPRKKKP